MDELISLLDRLKMEATPDGAGLEVEGRVFVQWIDRDTYLLTPLDTGKSEEVDYQTVANALTELNSTLEAGKPS